MIEIVFEEKNVHASAEINASSSEYGAVELIKCSNGIRKVSRSILNISDHYRLGTEVDFRAFQKASTLEVIPSTFDGP